MATALSVLLPFLMVNRVLHTLTAYLSPKCLVFPTFLLLLSYSLVYPCRILLHLLLCSFQVFSCLFALWLWLDIQSVMNSYGPGLYRTHAVLINV